MAYRCCKCGNDHYGTSEVRTTGGILSKIFDVQNRKFTAVSCSECGYTELYKGDSRLIGNIFDFVTN